MRERGRVRKSESVGVSERVCVCVHARVTSLDTIVDMIQKDSYAEKINEAIGA